MKGIARLVKNYFFISLISALVIIFLVVVDMIRLQTLPLVNVSYITKVLLAFAGISLILLPVIALLDLLIVRSFKALFNDYKGSDKTGKLIIIISIIVVLLRKIYYLTK